MARLGRYLAAWRPFAETHYSQEGEDILLSRIFLGQGYGHYVDLGAHHPFRFSNSYWAYRRGWSGIVIDGAPGTRSSFSRYRPRDIAVEECVGEVEGYATYYSYRETALNTTQEDRRHHIDHVADAKATVTSVPARPLKSILDEYLPESWDSIDFMSIDIEGSEWLALSSNDWQKYRPRVLVLEMLSSTLNSISETREATFLRSQGYVPASMLFHSAIFVSDPELLKRWVFEGSGGEQA